MIPRYFYTVSHVKTWRAMAATLLANAPHGALAGRCPVKLDQFSIRIVNGKLSI